MPKPKRKKYVAPTVAVADKFATSIPEFCALHGISLGFFYVLDKQGLAPRTLNIGTRRLITIEEAARWREARLAASAAEEKIKARVAASLDPRPDPHPKVRVGDPGTRRA